MNLQNKFVKSIFYLFFPLVCGSIIGLIMSSFIDYGNLIKPLLAPPGWLFPIIWSIIYLLLGISFYLYKNNDDSNKNIDLIYYISLGVNILWSVFFFILKWRLFTIFWTLLLLYLVIELLIMFFKTYKPSFYLNILYLLWLLFATYLTIGVYILNK